MQILGGYRGVEPLEVVHYQAKTLCVYLPRGGPQGVVVDIQRHHVLRWEQGEAAFRIRIHGFAKRSR